MHELIDISTWEDDRMADYGGYTRKCGKIDENGTRWMVKFEKKHSFKSAPLNLFNQHINSEILRILGFSAQETFLGICDDYLVLCCKNFVPKGSKLITFDIFLRQLYNSYELTEFTDLEKFEHVMSTNELLKPYKNKLTKSFWDMVVLDVFLMNLERTTTNYGYLISKDVVTPAPFFDNRTDGQACTVPLRKDGKPILRDDLLYSNEFKDFHDSVARILPVLECKMDDIYNLIHKQECLSESQKSWKFEQLQKTLHDLKCSYAIQQVSSTMAIENLNFTEQARKNLKEIATGQKTVAEIIEEIKHRYS